MADDNLAVVAAPGVPGGYELRPVAEPVARPHEAIVSVRAISLNRGEVRNLLSAEDGQRVGWDVAGVVSEAAATGGPPVGTRVVGLSSEGGWARRVRLATSMLARLADEVSFEVAATLPVAGLTALYTVRYHDDLDGRRVLVTGAAGGVGRFAIQLAAQAGAEVTAVVGRPERAEGLGALGAKEVVIGQADGGQFDLVLESVGGASLTRSMELVAPGGVVVVLGNSSGEPTAEIDATFYRKHRARLTVFQLAAELIRTNACSLDLGHLAALAASGHLDVGIGAVASWIDAGPVFERLMARQISGKAVLTVI
jgi:NADPH:quinone reductase-like Zn-dependent oxidoreductase